MILGVVGGLVAVNAEGCDSWCLEVPHWLALRPVDSLYPHSGFMPISSHKLLVPALFPPTHLCCRCTFLFLAYKGESTPAYKDVGQELICL